MDELSLYTTNLERNGVDVGTNLEVRDIMIDSGEEVTLDYHIINLGNVDITLDVVVQPQTLVGMLIWSMTDYSLVTKFL